MIRNKIQWDKFNKLLKWRSACRGIVREKLNEGEERPASAWVDQSCVCW